MTWLMREVEVNGPHGLKEYEIHLPNERAPLAVVTTEGSLRDALLIKHAPELLAALKDLWSVVQEESMFTDPGLDPDIYSFGHAIEDLLKKVQP